ncbi:hypothetical protein ACQEVB_30360 [Pseudonocardia sp. CA-107938]|uniref:hypothetical protein n=1 Tax=Pseudonocardia sp. CA-107938 TaxID=3240021 RepID=UPI003D8D7DD5
MLDVDDAERLAAATLARGLRLGQPVELAHGWFFPYYVDEPIAGSQGVIVNKRTGRLFQLGSAYPVQRDLVLYDQGYQFELYDLVVLEVRDVAMTVDVLRAIGPTVVEPTYEDGVVWRIPRMLDDDELRERIAHTPYVFGGIGLYHRIEYLEQARHHGWFRFLALECPQG